MLHRGNDRYWSRKLKEHTEKRSTKKALFNQRAIEDLEKGLERWKKEVYERWTAESPELKVEERRGAG